MKRRLSLVLLIFTGLFASSCTPILQRVLGPVPNHMLESNDEFKVIWDVSDIQVIQNIVPMMVSAPGKIIVEGYKDGAFFPSIFILDSLTGEILRQIQGGNEGDSIISAGNILYRGMSGNAEVQAYDIDTGKMLWDTWLFGGHSVTEIYSAENKVFVDTNNDLFFVLNAQGNILKTVHTSDRMFLEKDNVLYMEKFPSIAATDINSKNELWQVELGHLIDHAPIFDEGTIFLDTQSNPNTIYSVDQVSGKVNWKVNQSVLSNMYVSGDRIYFINDLDNGYLVMLDRHSGSEDSKLKISPPLDLYMDYYVTGDQTNNVLTVSFGDNNQIMGLKIVNP